MNWLLIWLLSQKGNGPAKDWADMMIGFAPVIIVLAIVLTTLFFIFSGGQ